MKPLTLPLRQVHLDFHTGPAIADVGRDFNADEFARVMKDAHVNSVTVFAKCHHGHLYYDTKRPERHPGLKAGLNLLGEQIEALHRLGIRAPIYISVQCDEYAANTHPEWVARNPDSSQVKAGGVFNAAWQILDMSTPYQEYLAGQTREVLKAFHPVDGIFFDMCWDQPSTTREFLQQMRTARLNPQSEADRQKYAHHLAISYMKRFKELVQKSSRGASVYFNSRPLSNLREELPYLAQVEIEALPTGGWGYVYFPRNIRFARRLGKFCLGMTARFHKSWADFGSYKPSAALEYETSQMIANGAGCSIGDQLHPRGKLDAAAYRLIGQTYQRIEEREPWVVDATAVAEIAVFQPDPEGRPEVTRVSGSDEGVTRMLTQLKQQFDFVDSRSDWRAYRLLVLPDNIQLDEALLKKVRGFIRAGGALLATGLSGLNADGTALLLSELAIKPHGLSPFTTTYLRLKNDELKTDHVIYESGVRVIPARGSTVIAGIVEPYFERSWDHFSSHFQTPPDRLSEFAAATIHGGTAYINFPIFGSFARHGSPIYRELVRMLLQRLLPEPLVRVEGPTGLEVTLTRQEQPTPRVIVHLLSYSPERRAEKIDLIEDVLPLYRVPLSLKLNRRPASVYLAPHREKIEFGFESGRANLIVPEVRGHAMVVFE
jgi:hypothetical protein